MSDLSNLGVDPRLWVDEWLDRYGYDIDSLSVLREFFAAAIEAGRRAGRREVAECLRAELLEGDFVMRDGSHSSFYVKKPIAQEGGES